jgi:hypothetical protein
LKLFFPFLDSTFFEDCGIRKNIDITGEEGNSAKSGSYYQGRKDLAGRPTSGTLCFTIWEFILEECLCLDSSWFWRTGVGEFFFWTAKDTGERVLSQGIIGRSCWDTNAWDACENPGTSRRKKGKAAGDSPFGLIYPHWSPLIAGSHMAK